ncbi:tryptophan synthase subunit alpha [Candidatus Kinetoplastidibacterium crithidiae]|uniref:Tryptophan synthase alpha chain n=1 Tax=Candidatus Kinetoplastidibacterium crithidiae TCC036E TaxID=1208918 RepID=M1M6R5_9PROT|nr:tryptophan synthase subunit alpha [Candidatus Kinetoplastibacterium crithidii]AFZ82583.1 tryptophan synthase subunit alpha 1 [Candidatus Kinetoplastibacterium crithidii (ex Angomonas deanei ATCC 30255)]AGF47755.1 tryptophan synthase alpha chain [Candidatus Kinetoplastibacterium crithidii TCC036E]
MNTKINRIESFFSSMVSNGRKSALVTYVTAGDPSINSTVPLMHSLAKSGADILEIGIPFSDPMADGPVIQKASERAIKNGMTLKKILTSVEEFRIHDKITPVVLMGYANPIESIGQKQFAKLAQTAGVDGVLVVDYTPEESDDFSKMLSDVGINMIFLLSPTSGEDRIKKISKIANGYVYYVSLRGVTGSKKLNAEEVAEKLQLIRKYINIPVGVGFGIRDAESAKQIGSCADAVVIGSKIIEIMHEAANNEIVGNKDNAAISAASDWISNIRKSLDSI